MDSIPAALLIGKAHDESDPSIARVAIKEGAVVREHKVEVVPTAATVTLL